MIAKGFKECYTSNASIGCLGGSYILWEDEKAGNAGSEHDSLSGECENRIWTVRKPKLTDNRNADHGRNGENEYKLVTSRRKLTL